MDAFILSEVDQTNSTPIQWTSATNSSFRDAHATDYPIDLVFYCCVVPLAILFNLVCGDIVRRLLQRRKTMRRSIPDVCVGLLTLADITSLMLIHCCTILAVLAGWNRLPSALCYYQGFLTSLYLKVEFLLQVAISSDRFFALLKPLHYRAYSSRRLVTMTSLSIVVFSVFITSLAFSIGSSRAEVARMVADMPMGYTPTIAGTMLGDTPTLAGALLGDTPTVADALLGDTPTRHAHNATVGGLHAGWPKCYWRPGFETIADIILIAINATVFIVGFICFTVCNCAIVHVLWTYHAKRESTLLKDLSDALRNSKRNTSQGKSATSSVQRNTKPSPSKPTSKTDASIKTNSNAHASLKINKVVSSPSANNRKPEVGGKGGVLFYEKKTAAQQRSNSIPPDDPEESTSCNYPKRYHLRADGQLARFNDCEGVRVSDVEIQRNPGDKDDFHFTKPQRTPTKNEVGKEEDYNPNEVYVIAKPLANPIYESNENARCNVEQKQIQDLPKILVESEQTPVKPKKVKKANKIKVDVRRLLKAVVKGMKKQKKEIMLAKMVLLCSILFLVTWIPKGIVIALEVCNIKFSEVYGDLALKVIFLNALLNPIVHGVCRGNYRDGFSYVLNVAAHHSFWCCVKRPLDTKLFREPPKRRRKRELAQQTLARKQLHREKQMENLKRHKEKIRRLEHQQEMERQEQQENSYAVAKRKAEAVVMGKKNCYYRVQRKFDPSVHLQNLFDKCIQDDTDIRHDSSLDSQDSSISFDYDALLADDGQVYMHLKNIWDITSAMNQINSDDSDSSSDLDVDYDKLGGLLDAAESRRGLGVTLDTSAVLRKSLRSSINIAHV